MRIQYTAFLLLLLAGSACNRNNVSIEGSVVDGEGQTISLERLDVNRISLLDSTTIGKGDRFSISTNIENPELFVLRHSNGEIVNLLIAPGENISLTTEAESFGKGYDLEGSEESENIRILIEQLNATRSTLDSLQEVAATVSDPESPHLKVIRNAYAQTIVNQKRFTIRYLVGHMTSLSSVYALYQKYDEEEMVMGLQSDLQYFKVIADSLEISHPNSSLTKSLRADISRREAEFSRDSQLNTLIEMAGEASGLLDLSIPDRDGKELSISDFKGKAVMLVFWASGNQASINQLLQLKSTYKLYHQKGFEVYAISLDNNKVQWMEAIDYNEFNWINVSELSYPESRADKNYNVSSLPAGFLINREGDIVARDLFGRTLETWLDNLL
ncbi:MAG: TlpA disulfide reductase family protein [Bacteroides sp.]|nr:TlpA disulfide reductase family protein [Bacteroides sp.]